LVSFVFQLNIQHTLEASGRALEKKKPVSDETKPVYHNQKRQDISSNFRPETDLCAVKGVSQQEEKHGKGITASLNVK
jgi:hypothetical protein